MSASAIFTSSSRISTSPSSSSNSAARISSGQCIVSMTSTPSLGRKVARCCFSRIVTLAMATTPFSSRARWKIRYALRPVLSGAR